VIIELFKIFLSPAQMVSKDRTLLNSEFDAVVDY